LEAIRKHPEMVLKPEDFVGWRINWQDKARNIAELVSSLNLGLDSAVFLDDSPFERSRVKETLPQVLVPEMPGDPVNGPSFLASLRCFDNPRISKEDRNRTAMYTADRARTELKSSAHSMQEWLAMLDLGIVVEDLKESNLERAAQLFNKTNQMNLSTRRLTAPELMTWSKSDGHRLLTFRVTDKFGDYGLCGLASVTREGTSARLVDFVLSCRVIGRGVEETMLCTAAQEAQKMGCRQMQAVLVPSAKNQPCQQWFQNHPALQKDNNSFSLELDKAPQFPSHVRTVWS